VDGALGARALALMPLVLLLLAGRRSLALLEAAWVPLLLAVCLLVGVERLGVHAAVGLVRHLFSAFFVHLSLRQPPIGARGFDPQKTWVPSIPTRCTSTVFNTIDFAVAVPTPTGPPEALYP